MDLYEAMGKRFSVRAYQNKPVEEERLRRVLDAGRLSQTARNRQERKFVVVQGAKLKDELAAAAEQPFLKQAAAIIAVVGLTPKEAMSCRIPTDVVDCAIAIDHMTLAAVAEGLGTCWIGHFDQDKCRGLLGVPSSAMIVGLLPIGYPAETARKKSRKGHDDVVRQERFS
jgi:nitroreductase